MMKINRPMREALNGVRLDLPLSESLQSIADSGFELRDECYFLRALLGSTNASRKSFPDCIGYECFINSLHVEDYDSASPLTQAVLLVKEVFRVWNAMQLPSQLTAVVSASDSRVVVRFHVRRAGEQWLSDDIEGYDDPVMSMESSEDVIASLNVLPKS
ncbi:hypothetical protein [Burkholderia sp. RS02]|uniref:hypothetical protein n=1 Tax=unclassified Burkholderia TaxID=2613784 RepID=UPI003218D6AF